MAVRPCSRCGKNESANRKGKPGRCVECIDAMYRALKVDPEGTFASPGAPRNYRCQTCGRPGVIPYKEIQSRSVELCDWCVGRRMYEDGLARDPEHWLMDQSDVARMVREAGFEMVDGSGRTLPESQMVSRIGEVWESIDVVCVLCAAPNTFNAVHILSSSSKPWTHCYACFTSKFAGWQNEFYGKFGLIREHDGYAKLSDPVSAHCAEPDCGASRKVSICALAAGAPPCLRCAEGLDPDLPHWVYLIHFLPLGLIKVGITHSEPRVYDRVAAHISRGGVLIDRCLVPNREAARTVEDRVLESMRQHLRSGDPRDFPQGGWTETWVDSAPSLDFGAMIDEIAIQKAPGFDRGSRVEDSPSSLAVDGSMHGRFVFSEEVSESGEVTHTVTFVHPLLE